MTNTASAQRFKVGTPLRGVRGTNVKFHRAPSACERETADAAERRPYHGTRDLHDEDNIRSVVSKVGTPLRGVRGTTVKTHRATSACERETADAAERRPYHGDSF